MSNVHRELKSDFGIVGIAGLLQICEVILFFSFLQDEAWMPNLFFSFLWSQSGCSVLQSVAWMEGTCFHVCHPAVLLSCPQCMNRGPEFDFQSASIKTRDSDALPIIPVLGKWRQKDSWNLLDSPCTGIVEPQVQQEILLQKIRQWAMKQYTTMMLTSGLYVHTASRCTCTCTCGYTQTYRNHTHRQRQTETETRGEGFTTPTHLQHLVAEWPWASFSIVWNLSLELILSDAQDCCEK